MIICCIEDQTPTLEILEILINEQLPQASIFKFSNNIDAYKFAASNHIDLIITDLDFFGSKELNVINYAKEKKIPVIVYSANDSPIFVNTVFKKGATTFISKLHSLEYLKNAIKSWDNLSPKLGTHLPIVINNNYQKLQLNDRDKEIIKLIIQGNTREEIGKKLNLSVNTINSYLRDMCSNHECKKEELIYRFLKWEAF